MLPEDTQDLWHTHACMHTHTDQIGLPNIPYAEYGMILQSYWKNFTIVSFIIADKNETENCNTMFKWLNID